MLYLDREGAYFAGNDVILNNLMADVAVQIWSISVDFLPKILNRLERYSQNFKHLPNFQFFHFLS